MKQNKYKTIQQQNKKKKNTESALEKVSFIHDDARKRRKSRKQLPKVLRIEHQPFVYSLHFAQEPRVQSTVE